MNDKKLDPYIPEKEVTKTITENIEDVRFDISNFEYNEEIDEFIYPENAHEILLITGTKK